jgi:hypothetical protein
MSDGVQTNGENRNTSQNIQTKMEDGDDVETPEKYYKSLF